VSETGSWLTLDGNQVSGMAWAVWRFPLPEEQRREHQINENWLRQVLCLGRLQLGPRHTGSAVGIRTITPPGRSPGNYVTWR
jgi:hypothetical protein